MEELANDLRRLGVRPADTVMLHASVRSVGEVAGGPDSIHLALKSVLTERGTLMMYVGCPRFYDEVGGGTLSLELEAELREKLPAFDSLTSRSDRDHGVLVEFLRTYPGSRVNHHVARFVFWGRHTEYFTAIQPWNYAYGANSALERFLLLDGRILLLGSDHDAVTFLHYVEHVADLPGKRIARYQVPVLENNRRVWQPVEEFNTSDGVHPNWPDRFFAKIVDTLLAQTKNKGGQVGDSSACLLSARDLFDFALPIMEAVARDPLAATPLKELG